MRRLAMCLLILTATTGQVVWAAAPSPSVIGRWQTTDDDTHAPASIVRVYLEGGQVEARVEKLLGTGHKPDERCRKCEGENKDKPVVGMKVVWGLSLDGDTWQGGSVLDPKNGKVYRCKLRRISDDQLEIRGYLGLSLFGRSQTWQRLSEEAPAPVVQPVPTQALDHL